ncbi:MAG: AmmeMemoRadiSam system radical SAM enzyme [Desulfobacteraceae bacterium]|nr:MAG: AmmeMemoRadiSam system radical SAM enzyme [Desulfobacteraceae bacterium]
MHNINRRTFLYTGALLCCNSIPDFGSILFSDGCAEASVTDIRGTVFKRDAPETIWKWSCEGRYYTNILGDKTVCLLCPNKCVLSPGDRSVCRVRVNVKGKLYSLVYGNPCAVNVDPIEKKPLYHFKPGTPAFSIATTGCSFRCLNCQNWEISQAKPHEVRYMEMFPEQVVQNALRAKAVSIAYTYSEATVFYEYMMDTAKLAKDSGLSNLWISNGYINPEPLAALCGVLGAANVNLKAFSDEIYRKLNGGTLEPVLNTFKTLHEHKVHFEITNLVVPGYTDDDEMVKKMCGWILSTLGPDYPLHFSRFAPKYKLDRLPPTPVSTLTRFRNLAMKEGIRYVYVGNIPDHEGNHTYCHGCGKRLIERKGFFINRDGLDGDQCRYCKTRIPGVWI